jgi:hypothetical protein
MVFEGFKRNQGVAVTQIAGSSTILPRNRITDLGCCLAGGTGIRISGLPLNPAKQHPKSVVRLDACILGDYTKQPGKEGGRPTYKGGADGDQAVWYYADEGDWLVGEAFNIGTNCGNMYAHVAPATTPDAVLAGQWFTSDGLRPNAAVKCTRL